MDVTIWVETSAVILLLLDLAQNLSSLSRGFFESIADTPHNNLTGMALR